MFVCNIVCNLVFYWIMVGFFCVFDIYVFGNFFVCDEFVFLDYFGLVLFMFGEVCNWIVYQYLVSLCKLGGMEKGILNCIGSNLVMSLNYMFEVMVWVGVILISRSWVVVVFICMGIIYMRDWLRGKEKVLRKEFGDWYKNKRYIMLFGFIQVIGRRMFVGKLLLQDEV